MKLIYSISARKNADEQNGTEFTKLIVNYYHSLKELSIFGAVGILTDVKTNEFMILAVSIELHTAEDFEVEMTENENVLMQQATDAGIVIKINRFEATMASDSFIHMLKMSSFSDATI